MSFKEKEVNVMLNGLILGESLLNDAMAIVMCHAINDFNATSAAHGEEDAFLMAGMATN